MRGFLLKACHEAGLQLSSRTAAPHAAWSARPQPSHFPGEDARKIAATRVCPHHRSEAPIAPQRSLGTGAPTGACREVPCRWLAIPCGRARGARGHKVSSVTVTTVVAGHNDPGWEPIVHVTSRPMPLALLREKAFAWVRLCS